MPDFLIVGTPKSGTTAIQNYLSQQKGVFMPKEKEIHFFGEEFKSKEAKKNIYWNDISSKEYEELFKEAKAGDIIGEASVFYLYSKSACAEIHNYNPGMKIVACFRNPIDFLVSYHQDALFVENENIEDFWEALKLEKERKEGRRIPNTNYYPFSLYYSELVDYSKYLKNYIEVFGNKNVHVIIFEEFFKDVDNSFQKLLSFLEVNEEKSEINFSRVNPRRNIKSKNLNNFIRRPSAIIRWIARIALPSQKLRFKVYNSIRNLNTSNSKVNSIDKEKRVYLEKVLKPKIEAFEKLISKDLSLWKTSR